MSRRRNFTPQEKNEIIALREKGWGLERLAEEFSCTVGSISWCCLMNGVTAPGNAHRKPIDNTYLEPNYTRNGKSVRRFSPQEDRLIEDMREKGETIAAICRATDRRHNSIIGRLCAIARRKELKGETYA
jgi:transposase-like protein